MKGVRVSLGVETKAAGHIATFPIFENMFQISIYLLHLPVCFEIFIRAGGGFLLSDLLHAN